MLQEDLGCCKHWGGALGTLPIFPGVISHDMCVQTHTGTNRHTPLPAHTCMITSYLWPTQAHCRHVFHTSPHNLNTHKHTFPTLSEIYPLHAHQSKSRCNALGSHTLHTPADTPALHTTCSFHYTPIQLMLLTTEIYHTPVSKPSHIRNLHTSRSPTYPSHISVHSATTSLQQNAAHILYIYIHILIPVYIYPCACVHTHTHTDMPCLCPAYIYPLFPRDHNSTVKKFPGVKHNSCLQSLKIYYLKLKNVMGK